jgi:GH15 family glucan-1,4-alpha-glucosidase
MSTDTASEADADTEAVTEADHVDVEAANASDAATGTKSTGTARGEHPTFPAIADYAFLSDCEVNCLIAPSGAVEWMCAPRPDSPSFFSSLLDRSAGSFRVGPFGAQVPAARRYLPGTLVLETTWQTPTGWMIVHDALVVGPWHNVEQRSNTHRRAPTDADAAHVLVRTIECVYGTVDLSLLCRPAFDYNRVAPTLEYGGDGYSTVVASAAGHPKLTLTSSVRMGLEGRIITGRTRLR